MTDARLIDLIEAWGADTNAFPETEREAASRRLAESPETFAAALDNARSVDGLLSGLPEILPSAALTARLVESAPKPARASRNWLAMLPRWPAVGAFASLAIGLVIGLNGIQPAATDSSEDAVDTLVYAALGYDSVSFDQETIE
ncbi:hypothetical protein HJO_00410 [Hyphomonas johnsonii MHS-2]|uniref:Uncharacterized protein n=2 Tax=Hyphomonas johnsonii TaxID=81031 RepID=A0A059FT48_9PROT|nr:hypothetical protein HJO_00410 [Hyphomonas johnsonii MHS-2]